MTGEYLYWQPAVDNLIFTGEIDQVVPSNFSVPKTKTILADFDWESGFRVGAGVVSECNAWDLGAKWTRITTSPSKTVSASTPSFLFLFGGEYIPDVTEQEVPILSEDASSRWKFEFNALDVSLSHSICLTECFRTAPYIGVKAVWTKQRYELSFPTLFAPIPDASNYMPFGFADLFAEAKTFGIGPQLGIYGKWDWFCNFGIYGDVSGAMMWTRYSDINASRDLTITAEILPEPVEIIAPLISPDWSRIRPMVAAQVGLDWEGCFWCDRVSVHLKVGYEVEYFWRLFPTLGEGDFDMQGLVISLSVGI